MSSSIPTADTRVESTVKSKPTPPPKPQFDRMKGAKWFEDAKANPVMILGQGGIGSWLTLLITRLGATVHIYDMDRYEPHNMSGQLVRHTDMDKQKVAVSMEICKLFNVDPRIVINGEYTSSSYAIARMLCGFDNMNARKVAFTNWKKYVVSMQNQLKTLDPANTYDPAQDCFFQDGRLTAEQLQIFNIPGDRPDLIEKYETEQLFTEAEGFEGDCTFKQTSHCAAMIASHMVGFYTNWMVNRLESDPEYRKLPYSFEYVIPFNLTTQDYANT